MIAAVHFRNFKALRSTGLRLEPFNLLIGPNGSGKTSLIEALLRLRTLAGRTTALKAGEVRPEGPSIGFDFRPPYQRLKVHLGCVEGLQCDLLQVGHPPGPEGEALWAELREKIRRIRGYLFDHHAMATPAALGPEGELASNGGNLAAVLAARREAAPADFAALEAEFCRIMPEFSGLEPRPAGGDRFELGLRLAGNGTVIPGDQVSQGTLYLLVMLALAFDPAPPAITCIEEADRGIHPRLLREVRDALYRLSHPEAAGLDRAPVQVVVTTHSPYLLDHFRDHPEEVVLANKSGQAATFERLSDRPDVLELMQESNLGDLWYSGILGGVPGDGER